MCDTFSKHLPRTFNICTVYEVNLTLEGSSVTLALSESITLLFKIEISTRRIKYKMFYFFTTQQISILLMLTILNTIKNGKFDFWLRKINHQIHCYNYLQCYLHIICFCICLQSYLTTFYSLFPISGTFTIHMIIAALRAQTLFTAIVISMATILDILFLVICRATYMKGWN